MREVIKNSLYSIIPKVLLRDILGYVAVGERQRPNPFFLTLDAIESDYNCIFDDKTRLPFKSGSVSVIYTSHNLEHFQEHVARNFFSEASRVLGVGGELLIEVPNCKQYYQAFHNYLICGEIRDINALTNYEFSQGVIDNVRKYQPNENLGLLNDIRTKFSLAISCYCDPPFVGDHTPVIISNNEFDEAFKSKNMDDFFIWLISKQTPAQLNSGGHCSAWYPEKLVSTLSEYGFDVRLRGYKDSSRLPKALVPDRPHRSFNSFRVSAINTSYK